MNNNNKKKKIQQSEVKAVVKFLKKRGILDNDLVYVFLVELNKYCDKFVTRETKMKQEIPITNRYENIHIFGCFYFILFFLHFSLHLNLRLFFFRHTLLSIRLSFSMLAKHCLVLWKYSEKLEFPIKLDYFHVFEHKSFRF